MTKEQELEMLEEELKEQLQDGEKENLCLKDKIEQLKEEIKSDRRN